MLRRTLAVLSSATLLLLGSLQVANAAIISVGPFVVPANTDPFAVPILITGGVEVTAWSFDLTYDATDLQINTNCDPFTDPFCSLITGPVTEGAFFSAGAPFNLLVPGFIDLDASLNQTGLLFGVNGAYGGFPPAPSGDGIIAYVEFIHIGTGNGDSIRVTNTSTTAAVPEPATLALLACGLLLLGAAQLRRRDTI